MHPLVALGKLDAHSVHLLPGPLDALRGLPDAARHRAHGLLQLLHSARLLHGALAEGLGGNGHLLRAGGDMLRAGDDLSHRGVEPLEDIVQGGADGGKVSDILLGDLRRQIAAGNGLQHVGDLPDIVSQAADGVVKALGQRPDLIVGVDLHHHGLVLVQAQISLLQRLGQNGQTEEGLGNRPLDIGSDQHDSDRNQRNAG